MTESPPPSLLVTPDARRRLQQRYEEAMRLGAQSSCDRAAVHAILAACVRDDPASTLYLDALLANLRQWSPRPRASWFSGWRRRKREHRSESAPGTPHSVLTTAPDLLHHRFGETTILLQLANAAADCDLDDIELRYLTEARRFAPDDVTTLRQLARCLTRQGRLEEAINYWQQLAKHDADSEATQAASDLEPAALAAKLVDDASLPSGDDLLATARQLAGTARFAAAEQCLARAQQAAGGNLAILAEREDLRLAHSQLRLVVARRRAESDPHPKAQALVGRMELEHNRLEIDIFHLRSERHPHDQRLKVELARRLKRAGNYSGAIQRLEEALVDNSLAAEVRLELGECWQHLRQFKKGLAQYKQAAESSPAGDHRATLLTALYRIGVLAAAMNEPGEARAALTRLVAIQPDYKDARERLDKLP
jgi:tetratricopeptide (TPR) repeat protein